MKRTLRLGFLVLASAWFLAGLNPARIRAEVQCTATGLVEQDNFSQLFDGWYCSVFPDSGLAHCNLWESECEGSCAECGGVALSGSCSYEASDSWPNGSSAQTYGCTSSLPWANKYRLTCTCYYEPDRLPLDAQCNDDWECCSGICSDYDHTCRESSPLLINLKNDSPQYHLTSATDGVLFDVDGDGVMERIAWTKADSPIAFLTLDTNSNGVVDDGKDLFGTATVRRDGTRAKNGFDALSDFDDNRDGRIDSNDAVYARLRAWIDSNHNGRSEPSELFPLPAVDVMAISTTYWLSKYRDQHGNVYRFEGTALISSKNKLEERRVFDVFFAVVR